MKPHSTTDKDVAHEPKIPKIIHYVWLGGGEKNETIKKCMRSWEKFCPGYQIIEWNEERIKGIDNQFLREAIESKYWAFASDFTFACTPFCTLAACTLTLILKLHRRLMSFCNTTFSAASNHQAPIHQRLL